MIRITTNADGYILFGDSSVTATATTGHYLQSNTVYDLHYDGATNFSFITTGASGTLYASELV